MKQLIPLLMLTFPLLLVGMIYSMDVFLQTNKKQAVKQQKIVAAVNTSQQHPRYGRQPSP